MLRIALIILVILLSIQGSYAGMLTSRALTAAKIGLGGLVVGAAVKLCLDEDACSGFFQKQGKVILKAVRAKVGSRLMDECEQSDVCMARLQQVGSISDAINLIKDYATVETPETACHRDLYVRYSITPEAAQHIVDAQAAGYSKTLTYEGNRQHSDQRRRQALKGYPTSPGRDRDEYPPSVFLEGGAGASVRLIKSEDNQLAGAIMGARLKTVPAMCKVTMIAIP